MDRKLGMGVIGVGTFGSLHAKVYGELHACELRAVADVSSARLEQARETLGVPAYADYRDLLARDDVDAVSICTTDEAHVEPAVAAAKAGKHVLVEKPLALEAGDCDQIIEATSGSGVRLMVGHILRFDPRYVTARERIQRGAIGELVHVVTRRNNPIASAQRLAGHTSVVFFLGIHDIDFVNWCVGAKPHTVYAQAVSKRLPQTPDTVLATLRFPGDVVASLEFCWVLPESYPGGLDAHFDAVGTGGAVYVKGGCDTVTIAHERFEQPELFYAPQLLGDSVGILRDELAHFVRCVAQGAPPVATGDDGKAAVEVAQAMERSYRTGTIVELA
jgi:UDP-N-acetylglucosamine 3-dehydrogenase